jgi:hypothetical protein
MKCTAIAMMLVLLFACQRDERHEPRLENPQRVGERVDIHGISVAFVEGGHVEVRGRDRWGRPLDTTFENIDFLRRALPVLARSITDEQANGLRMFVAPTPN